MTMTDEQLAKVNHRQNLETVLAAIAAAGQLCFTYDIDTDILSPINEAHRNAKKALKAAREDEAAVRA